MQVFAYKMCNFSKKVFQCPLGVSDFLFCAYLFCFANLNNLSDDDHLFVCGLSLYEPCLKV